METHKEQLPKMKITSTYQPSREIRNFIEYWEENKGSQGWPNSFWDDMQLNVVEDYYKGIEDALTEAILSCGYQYDEVIQYLKQGARFTLTANNFDEYILYDKYQQKRFLLITKDKNRPRCSIDEQGNVTVEYLNMFLVHKNNILPDSYYD